MKNTLRLGLVLATVLTVSCTHKPDDVAALQGTWTPDKAEVSGQPLPDSLLQTVSLKITHNAYETLVAGETDKGTFTVDPTTTPKSMIVTGTDGPNRGKIYPAIYELDGDTVRICYDLGGTKRPAEFKSEAGTQLYLVTYHRKKA